MTTKYVSLLFSIILSCFIGLKAESVVYQFNISGEPGYVASGVPTIVENGALKFTIDEASTSWKARLYVDVNENIFAKPVMKIRYRIGTIQAKNANLAVTLKIDGRWNSEKDGGSWRISPVIIQSTTEWQVLIVDLKPLILSWEKGAGTAHGNIQQIRIDIGNTGGPFTGKEFYMDYLNLGESLGVEKVELNPTSAYELLVNTGVPVTGTPTVSNFSVTKDGVPLTLDKVFIRDANNLVIKLVSPIAYPMVPSKIPIIKISYNGNDAIKDASNTTLEAFIFDLSYESYSENMWKYWGKYVQTPFNKVKPAQWINTDSVVNGWDWSLPSFVKAPTKSTYSLARNFGLGTTGLNALTPPQFVCKPVVQHWVDWKDIEPTKDNFTFTQLISNINLSTSKGYSSIVRIHSTATTFAPSWVGTELGVPILPKAPGDEVQNYDVTDPRFHARYLKLVEQIGKSGIPQMTDVVGLYVGYSSPSLGDEGIGNDTLLQVRERLDAWANITTNVRGKVFMGGTSNYGLAKGFGIRRGFVEMYLNIIPNNTIGQLVDNNGYLYVDETNPIISSNLFHGEENEAYEERQAGPNGRFGISTASFPYRYFSSNLRLLQMRCNEALFGSYSLMPEMSAWIGQELGCTVDEAPDVWSFLRESYLASYRLPSNTVKNFERWLFQRDAPGYTTVPAVKISHALELWMVQAGKNYDYIAREGKKIGFNIDKNWNGVKDSLAFKVSVFDYNAGTLNLKYSNGNEIVTLSKPLLGDSLLKTYTFFVKDYKNGGNIGGKFDFTLEAGDNTNNIVVSFVRVINAEELIPIPVSGVTMSGCPASAINVTTKQQLTGTISPTDATKKAVTWTSSNTSVATVSATGLVSAVNGGTATITITSQDGGYTSICNVNVVVPVTGVTLTGCLSAAIAVNSTCQLMATVAPSNATNKIVSWSSSDTLVATVSSTGNITGKTLGSAIISATTQDGNHKANFTVRVFNIAVTGISFNPNSGMVQIDSTLQLSPIITPTTSTDKTVKYTTNSPMVATVDSLTGLVTGKTPGKAIITVTTKVGNFKAEYTVTVPEPLPSKVTNHYTGETLKIFPVPVDTKLYIQLPVETKIVSYMIKDITGKIQSKNNSKVFEGNLSIDVSNLKGGYYIIQLNFGNYVQSISFIKQ